MGRWYIRMGAALAMLLSAGCAGTRWGLPEPGGMAGAGARLGDHQAAFLLDEGRTRCMNVLSCQMPEATFHDIVARCEGWNTVWYVFLANRGDGTPPVTSFYVDDEHGGEVDPEKAALFRRRMAYLRAQGFRVVPWFFPDDSPAITGKDLATQKRYLSQAVAQFGDLFATDVCLGLELDEYWDADWPAGATDRAPIPALTEHLRDLLPGTRIGHHHTRLALWRAAIRGGADVLYGQYGFGLDEHQIRDATRAILADLDGRIHFVAAEYHLSSDSAAARALGRAADDAGAEGTGNGR